MLKQIIQKEQKSNNALPKNIIIRGVFEEIEYNEKRTSQIKDLGEADPKCLLYF